MVRFRAPLRPGARRYYVRKAAHARLRTTERAEAQISLRVTRAFLHGRNKGRYILMIKDLQKVGGSSLSDGAQFAKVKIY